MIVFLLKSSACLAVFLMFYKLLLEKERMHTFKRYYLLAALVLAIAIPSITFVEYIEVPSAPTPVHIESAETISTERVMPLHVDTPELVFQKTWTDYWPVILRTVYGLGVLLFALKFLFHIGKILRNIRNHPKIPIGRIIHVLLKDSLVPHTFLNYIFLNRQKFEAEEIPKEVLLHEAAHARQRHSLDVLFVELLQIVFWFNPLIHLSKKAIKLNHEFLADEAVLEQGASTPEYQNTLLAFASSAEYKRYQPSMANAINYSSYSSIKKRFKVMKTQASKKSILVRSLLLLPLLAMLLYSFSETKIVAKQSRTTESKLISFQEKSEAGATTAMMEEYKAFMEKYRKSEKKVVYMDRYERIVAIYDLMSKKQQTSVTDYRIIKVPLINLPKVVPEIPSQNDLDLWKDKKNCAIWIDGIVKENSILRDKKPDDFSHFTSSFVYKNARSEQFPQSYQVHLYTKKGFEETYQKSNVKNYKQLDEKYIKLRKHSTKNHNVDNSELRILKAQVDRAYDRLSQEEIRKYNVQRPDPLQTNSTYNKSERSGLQNKRKITILVNKKGQLLIQETLVALEDLGLFLSKLNDRLKKEGRKKIVRAEIIPDNNTTKNVIADVETILKKYGIAQIEVLEGNIPVPPPPQKGASKKQLSEFNSLAEKYNAQPKEKRIIPSGDLKKLEDIYGKMTEEQKADAPAFPECPDPNPADQEGATKKQVGEYNRLAKKYNEMLAEKGNIRIKKAEVDRLEYLYGIMTQEQRSQAEPFPDFPEPPEPPQPPAPPSEIEIEQQKNQMKKHSEEMEQQAAVIQEQVKKIEQQAMRMQKQALEIEQEREIIHEKARKMEVEKQVVQEIIENQQIYDDLAMDKKIVQEIIENQEIIAEERSLKTAPAWNLNTEETEIYLGGKQITYGKMKKMEREGAITSMNIIKKSNGNSVIKLNETSFRPPEPPTPPKPKSPLELLEELKKDNVKVILDGKEIGYKEAEKRFEENSFTRVNVRKEKGGRPVLEVSTN